MSKLFPKSVSERLGIPADISMRTPIGTLRSINQAIYNAYTDLTRTGRGLHRMYVPFGRYFIDHHRINDDILSLRRGNGVNIVGLPVRRLSKDLGEVVRTIVKN